MHTKNLLLTAQVKPSFLSLITPVSSSGYYNDWYFMCTQQRRKTNCRIIRVNNTFSITFKIICSLSQRIFQWISGPRSLWDFLSFCSVYSLVLSHKGGQVQLLSLVVPKVYRLTLLKLKLTDLEMQNFAELTGATSLLILFTELKNGFDSQIQCWTMMPHSFPIFCLYLLWGRCWLSLCL